jgi:hypothetical protein
MLAEAGIQAFGDNNNFKDLDARSRLKACRDKLRGHDGVFPITTQSPRGEGRHIRINSLPLDGGGKGWG